MGSSLVIVYLFPTKKTLSETFQTSKAQLGEQYQKLTEFKNSSAEDSIQSKEIQDDVKETESKK